MNIMFLDWTHILDNIRLRLIEKEVEYWEY